MGHYWSEMQPDPEAEARARVREIKRRKEREITRGKLKEAMLFILEVHTEGMRPKDLYGELKFYVDPEKETWNNEDFLRALHATPEIGITVRSTLKLRKHKLPNEVVV